MADRAGTVFAGRRLGGPWGGGVVLKFLSPREKRIDTVGVMVACGGRGIVWYLLVLTSKVF